VSSHEITPTMVERPCARCGHGIYFHHENSGSCRTHGCACDEFLQAKRPPEKMSPAEVIRQQAAEIERLTAELDRLRTACIEQEAAIADILANPGDDFLRLKFADWLDEHGEAERGEFIRVQVEIGYCQPGCGHFQCERLRQRERELFHWRMLGGCGFGFGPLQVDFPLPGAGVWAGTFRRGFVERADITLARWIGEPCSACLGHGFVIPTRSLPHDCRICAGTGRVNAAGPDICKCSPVSRVVTEKKPGGQAGYEWWWFDGDSPQNAAWWGGSHHLPGVVFKLLKGGKPSDSGNVMNYDAEEAAIDSLSQALIAFAGGQQ
jgi:uncharacterized protein (TIGR02996 family)